ncbi:MAG: hypothetical protein ROW52_10970 [Anaerolineaceae bacterium]|jgi:hypothetical protein
MNQNVNRLTEGLDEAQRQELGDMRKVAHFLASDVMPDPESEQLARALAALTPYLPAPAVSRPFGLRTLFRLARSQLVLFETSFWLAGLLILIIGLLMAVVDGRELLPLAFVLLSPLLAATGVAYAFRPETRALAELERLTATGPLELLYTRLALILGFNLLVALLLLTLIWLEGPQVALWRLTLAWLGPLLTLTGLALYATIRWGALVGVILPLGLWGSLALLGWREALLQAAEGIHFSAWLLSSIASSTPVLIGSTLACVLGLGLLVMAGRMITGEKQSWS